MPSHTLLDVDNLKDCPVWEVVGPAGITLRSTPDSGIEADNIIGIFTSGLLVERVEDTEYPDIRPDSGAVFARIIIGYNPIVYGFAIQRIVFPGGKVDYPLLQTVNALAACKILGTVKTNTC